MLPGPARDVKALALEARSLVFDVCFAPVTSRLATVHSLPSWAKEKEKDEVQGWGEQGDGGWDYDTVPQPYMTQVSYVDEVRIGLLMFAGSIDRSVLEEP